MALTTTVQEPRITLGNVKAKIFNLTFTSVTGGKISTGLEQVLFASYAPATSDDHGIVYVNYSDAGSTASLGDVYVDGVTQNDTGKLFVIGV